MKRFMPICLIAVLLLASCQQLSPNGSLEAKVGQSCVIEFRRGDALGDNSSNGSPPVFPNAQVSVNGILAAIEGDWIIMKPRGTNDSNWAGSNEIWIPRASILLIEFYP